MRTGPQGSRRQCMKRPLECDSVLSHVHMGTQTPPAVVTDTRDLALLGLQLADGTNAAPKGRPRQSSIRSLGEPCLLARLFPSWPGSGQPNLQSTYQAVASYRRRRLSRSIREEREAAAMSLSRSALRLMLPPGQSASESKQTQAGRRSRLASLHLGDAAAAGAAPGERESSREYLHPRCNAAPGRIPRSTLGTNAQAHAHDERPGARSGRMPRRTSGPLCMRFSSRAPRRRLAPAAHPEQRRVH